VSTLTAIRAGLPHASAEQRDLRKTGIDIARRTVAKYREAMRIPSSVERRRMKQEMGLPEGVAAP